MTDTSRQQGAGDPPAEEPAQFGSQYGFFDGRGREYVVTRPDPPRPWVNVITNGDYGCIVSQAGGGFSWRGNSQLKMLNRWEQDLIRDDYGRFLYLRDAESGTVWSADWQPTRRMPDAFRVRHGLGYTVTDLSANGIRCEKTVFVPLDAPCELWLVHLTNLSDSPRTIDCVPYLEWQLGAVSDWHREFHKTFIETEFRDADAAIFAWKKGDLEHADQPFAAFLALLSGEPAGFDTDKETFLGRCGDVSLPDALRDGRLAGRSGKWTDPIAALQARVQIAPGETRTVIFALGAGTREELGQARQAFATEEAVAAALARVKDYWGDMAGRTCVSTPDPALDLMANVWLKYQAIAGRLWARTGYYQNSGAFGFRDQLQDSHIWLPLDPECARQQILQHATHQFSDGTVQHWWHPDTDIASVTECSDDLLWLPFLMMNYIDETDDASVWDEEVPFLDSEEPAPLYGHAVRSIEKALSRFSPRGLPLIGENDWNDGFSHLGRKWRGESIWLGHFLVSLLRRFACHAEERGEGRRADSYLRRARDLVNAINDCAWDGEWYWRATKDNGETIGSRTCAENKIDLIAQAWAVIAGVAPPERAAQCMASARKYLFREYGPLLLTPAYTHMDPEIGYITRYAPGVRENGGVYSHAATWGIQALCMLGEGNAAWRAFASMCPPRRGTDPDLYYAEPYVMPGNIDGPDSPTFGRGGWTWYTGSAAWMQKVALEWICGVRATREGLLIDPCIPEDWPGFSARRRFRGATYEIEVRNPDGVQRGVRAVTLDGEPLPGNLIPPKDKDVHRVVVEMGQPLPGE